MKAGSVLSTESRGIADRLNHIFLPLANPIGGLLAMDTTAGPRHSREAFWADLPLAVRTGSKAAMVNPLQRGVYLAQQSRLPDARLADDEQARSTFRVASSRSCAY